MNSVLDKILANKTPEEFAEEMLEIRAKIGEDTIYDISVEDVLGIDVGPSINFQYPNITGEIENINVSKTPCTNLNDIFNQTVSNDISYSLAA